MRTASWDAVLSGTETSSIGRVTAPLLSDSDRGFPDELLRSRVVPMGPVVDADQSAVAGDVCGQHRGEPAFDAGALHTADPTRFASLGTNRRGWGAAYLVCIEFT